ncbi:ABC transporter substrate-binding protein [Brevundimonas sp.]|uniref:ABC transporter substrate-binding protein n=1 Tax=Brevundimonas sp. TaxID=1871086 RepID=UPI00286C3DD0|nr:ABC transporter substrate-binding protein [Brevundimonas sp.]
MHRRTTHSVVSRRLLLAGGVAVTAMGLASCGSSEAPVDDQGRVRIRFATDWRAQAEHGGFYQALASGEYARRGLDVQIVQGGPGVNVPQLLASGAVEAGMGSNGFIVMNLAQEGVPVKAVAAIMQKDPQVLIAHPGQGIETIADLKGRPILLSDASVTAFWVWLKSKYGFTDDQVRKYTFNSAPFLADKRVAQQGYVTSEPYTIEKAAGFKPNVFLLADEGYPGYATMILVPDSLIAKNPAAVKAFVEATAQGWKDYLNGDPSAADALIRKDNPEMTQDVLDQARGKLKSYGIVESGDAMTGGIGAMTDVRWAQFFEMASSQGVYPKTLDYKKAYTLQFVTPAAK